MFKGLLNRMRRSRSQPRQHHVQPSDTKTKLDSSDDSHMSRSIQRILEKCDAENSAQQLSCSNTEEACCVCLERVATVTSYPCAHRVTCRRCATLLVKSAKESKKEQLQCVICRCEVTKFRYNKPLTPIVIHNATRPPYELNFRHPSESSGSSLGSTGFGSVGGGTYAMGLLAGSHGRSSSLESTPCSSFSS